jgi:uncharacterized protein YjbI with pentapeptide repeats
MRINKKNQRIEAPKIPANLNAKSLSALLSEERYESGVIEDCSLDDQTAERISFDQVILRNVSLTEARLKGLELTDVIFEKCDLSNINFSNANIHRTEFRSCKMIGMDFSETTLRNVLFHECIGDYASFRFANFKQVQFQECSLRSSDFYQSVFQKVYMEHSNIDGAQLTGTKLEGMDLSSCEFGVIGVGREELQGCIIAREQASVFAALLGLVVKE